MTIQKIEFSDLTLINADCLIYLKTLPDNCIDLILTDPPYYKIKKDAWDNQWNNVEEYLGWLDDILAEFWRVLKPTGSLYMFCSPKLSAETEVLIKQRLNVLNSIVWVKDNNYLLKKYPSMKPRKYIPSSERVVFAEHYDAEGFAKGSVGYGTKCQELREQVFSPLIEYFKSAREKLNVSAKQINEATGTQMCSHWFSYSQWQLPSPTQYEQLQELFSQIANAQNQQSDLSRSHNELIEGYGELKTSYDGLVADYDDLKRQYEDLRRPFSINIEVPNTDVWHYPSVQYYPGKHPCEKPLQMMKDIINASSRPGDVIADFFLGGGNSLLAAKQLNRKGIGVELEAERFQSTVEKLKNT